MIALTGRDVVIILGLILLAAAAICGLLAGTVGAVLLKRKIRKEIGLWKRHRAFRPRPPSRERKLDPPMDQTPSE